MKTTVLTTLSKELPASSNIALTFSKLCFVAALISVTNSPVAGTSGICPEVKTKSPTTYACTYGPIACGALSV